MFPLLRLNLRGLARRAKRQHLAARLAREIHRCSNTHGALALVLLALRGSETAAEVDALLDRTVLWLGAAHPGAVVARVEGPAQIAILLPGASLARAQQFCDQLRRPTFGLSPVGDYLSHCVQGVAGWDPGLSIADLTLRAESALYTALSGDAPVVLYHDSLPRLLGPGAGPFYEDWSI